MMELLGLLKLQLFETLFVIKYYVVGRNVANAIVTFLHVVRLIIYYYHFTLRAELFPAKALKFDMDLD